MPWELGYFDGFNGAVAVLPITLTAQQSFLGQEYVNLYPWVDEGIVKLGSGTDLRIRREGSAAKGWSTWIASPRSR